jgi:hypothetical protein
MMVSEQLLQLLTSSSAYTLEYTHVGSRSMYVSKCDLPVVQACVTQDRHTSHLAPCASL